MSTTHYPSTGRASDYSEGWTQTNNGTRKHKFKSQSVKAGHIYIYINLPSRLLLFDPSQNRIVCRKGRLNGNNSYSFYLP